MAYQEYELRIYDVPVTLRSYVRTTCDVWTAYFTCHVRATDFKCTHKKCCTSVYEEYVLRIEEYELCMLKYIRLTRDVSFVS